jgi:hypothetical protein
MSSRKQKPYPSQRYGMAHRAMRKRLAPIVATGTVKCARCDEPISSGDTWQLDHRDDGRGWLGPSHARCNQRAGWEAMIRNQSGNGSGSGFEEQPYRWSQRWSEDPPVGTTVNVGAGMVEVYLGGGRRSHPVPSACELG